MSASACDRHPSRPAAGTCDSCGRAVCLECAVPFRGTLRCDVCAAREVGEEARALPADPPARPHRAAGIVFLAGALVSLLPWDEVGTRDGFLSAWSFRPSPWPLLAGVLLAAGAATVLVLGPAGHRRSARIAPVAIGALALVATVASLPTPDLTVRTPIPLLVLGASVLGTLLAAVGLRPTAAASLTHPVGTGNNRSASARSLGEGIAGGAKGAGMSQQGFDVSRLTMGQKVLFVTGALFLIVLFLEWENIGFGFGGVSGFQGIGVLAGILVIGLLVWEGIHAAGVNLNLNVSAALIAAGLAGATVVFGLIRFLIALTRTGTSPSYGAFIGLVLLLAMAYGAYVRYQESQTGAVPPPAAPPPA